MRNDRRKSNVCRGHSLMGTVSCISWLFVCNVKKGENPEEEEAKNYPVWKCLLLMVAGGVLVVKGSDFAVSGATEIARYFGMSERFIGLTIVALGTSLPELVTSVTAAKEGMQELQSEILSEAIFLTFYL